MISYDDNYFMNLALREAKKAYELNEVPVGAVIVSNLQVIAKAHNLTETLNDVTAHAEMLAFTSATNFLGGKYLHDCTLYVTLEPCQMCAGASYWGQLGRIVYGASDTNRGMKAFNSVLHPKTTSMGGILEEECGLILKQFFIEKRNLN